MHGITPIDLVFIILIVVALLILFAVYFANKYMRIRDQMNYLNIEIARTSGKRRKQFKRQRRHLWMQMFR